MNIVLAALNRNTIYTPLALLYCRACLRADPLAGPRVSVELKEFELDDSLEYVLWEIVRSAPAVIAFSCYLWNVRTVLRLSAMIRQVLPSAKIVLGGPEVSSRARDILAGNPAVDLVVRGEGEFVFARVIRAYLRLEALSAIEGITFRSGAGIIDNPGEPKVADLDSLPSVYRDGTVELANREVCLETQRGCVFGCEFCYYNKGTRGWRSFSMGRVKEELSYLLALRDITVYLMDPVFNIDSRRAKEICRFIARHNRYRIPFHTEIQAELVDAEMARLLKAANMRYVEVGLQSTDARVLANVRRPLSRPRFIRGYELLKKNRLVVELQLILGLPGDTPASFLRSLDFALELDPPVLSVFKLQVLPGTGIRRRARRLGLEFDAQPPYEFISSPTMSLADSIRMQKVVNSVSLFRRDRAARAYCRAQGIPLTALILRWLERLPSDGFLLNGENNAALEKEAKAFIRSLKK